VAPRTDVAKQFIAATKANDHGVYSRLFSADAQVTLDGGGQFSRAEWLDRTKKEFVASRHTRFFTGLAGGGRFVLVEVVRDCGGPPTPGVPWAIECFDIYRRETITLTPAGNQIQALERSDFSHGLSPDGQALLFIE
jgi:hypothetical protein